MADWLQGHFGAVPMTLLSWVRVAGNAWLAGAPHPQWPGSASADPLVIEVEGARYPGGPIREHYEHEYDTWRERSAQDRRADVLMLSLTPDRLHKENTSGGPALRDGASRRLRRRPGRRRDDHAVRVYLTRQAARRATSRPVYIPPVHRPGASSGIAAVLPAAQAYSSETPPSRHERAFSAQAFMHNYAGRSIARR
jgi:hypothetical protein